MAHAKLDTGVRLEVQVRVSMYAIQVIMELVAQQLQHAMANAKLDTMVLVARQRKHAMDHALLDSTVLLEALLLLNSCVLLEDMVLLVQQVHHALELAQLDTIVRPGQPLQLQLRQDVLLDAMDLAALQHPRAQVHAIQDTTAQLEARMRKPLLVLLEHMELVVLLMLLALVDASLDTMVLLVPLLLNVVANAIPDTIVLKDQLLRLQ